VKDDNQWGKFGAYSGLAFVLPITMWLGYMAGQWVDGHYGTKQGANLGLVAGLGIGLYETIRQVSRLEKNGKKK
jgi:hypothetical protein